ncbi:toxin-activating lysine-acyltransferase [Brevundimonas sp.]|uniref:toxin-activating lysine-acyltransferase n=1 Tax=Brevundimonas sp. TaxID=1871086 RepID=UPI003F700CB8
MSDTLNEASTPTPAAELGDAVMLLAATDRRRLSLGSVMVWVWPAIRLRQIHFLRDAEGRVLGYCTWAFLRPETADLLFGEAGEAPDLDDWNAGPDLWLIDVVAPFGQVRSLLRDARLRLVATASSVHARRGARRFHRTLGAPR